jgi:periplasmic protein TonB
MFTTTAETGEVRTQLKRGARTAVYIAAMSVLPVAAALAQQTAPSPQAPAAPAPQSQPQSPPAQKPPSAAVTSWQQALIARIARFQLYPPNANGAEGVVTLGFTIDRQGHLLSSRIVKSSGSAVLDAEALALIKRAAPLPAPPAELTDANLSFALPIRYAATAKE